MTIPYMGVFSGTHPARTLVPARATLVPAETKKRVKMSILAAFGTGRHNPSEGVVPAFKGILQSKSSSRHGRHNGTGVSGMIRKYVGKGGYLHIVGLNGNTCAVVPALKHTPIYGGVSGGGNSELKRETKRNTTHGGGAISRKMNE